MKFDAVKVQNYKSITEVTLDLTQSDRILSLIGQNESGKSSILEAIRDYHQGSFDEDSSPYDSDTDPEQKVSCTFAFEDTDDKAAFLKTIEDFANEEVFSENIKFKKATLNKISQFEIHFDGEHYNFDEALEQILVHNIEVIKEEEADPRAESPQSAEGEAFDGSILFPDLPEFLVKKVLPEFIYFEGGSCDTLPDFISIDSLVSEKGEGWAAVKWLEKSLQELTGNKEFTFKGLAA